jgi:hypothetical protein
MKRFDKSADAYAAGYALPRYSVERAIRSWRYRDDIFTTPVDVPVERVSFSGDELDALRMDKNEHSPNLT